MSLVKSVRLNGSTEFTDYGRYETVSNLSTTDQPQLTDEGVTWTLSDPDSGRFYFEVQPKDDFLGLPWDIDVSYILDGVSPARQRIWRGSRDWWRSMSL